ncbi:MAG: hypothetical protein ACFFD4_09595 [Candidatus Odinarchaeota archaeon]
MVYIYRVLMHGQVTSKGSSHPQEHARVEGVKLLAAESRAVVVETETDLAGSALAGPVGIAPLARGKPAPVGTSDQRKKVPKQLINERMTVYSIFF